MFKVGDVVKRIGEVQDFNAGKIHVGGVYKVVESDFDHIGVIDDTGKQSAWWNASYFVIAKNHNILQIINNL